MALRRCTKPIDGTIPVPALLYDDEEELASQDHVGLYDGYVMLSALLVVDRRPPQRTEGSGAPDWRCPCLYPSLILRRRPQTILPLVLHPSVDHLQDRILRRPLQILAKGHLASHANARRTRICTLHSVHRRRSRVRGLGVSRLQLPQSARS